MMAIGPETKRMARIAALSVAGAVGIGNRWLHLPKLALFLIAALVPVVWFATGFELVKPGETEAQSRQRLRNVAIGLALIAMVALFYLATMARLGGQALNRPM